LLDPARHALGEVIYERLDERAALERRELAATGGELVRAGDRGGRGRAVVAKPAPARASGGFDELALELRLYKTAKRIELVYRDASNG